MFCFLFLLSLNFFVQNIYLEYFIFFYNNTTTQPWGTYKSKLKKNGGGGDSGHTSDVWPLIQKVNQNPHLLYMVALV